MRFIRGDSLEEAIGRFHADEALKSDSGRRSLELRKLLRRFMDVCNAIDYAHSRGVLHRDIKPGNIIVGKHGETLVVDWGMAKATGRSEPGAEERTLLPSSASGSAETLPGSALGTPAYMSPEQARGDLEHLGPRSDVYSLGATLYCLLTGKPPQEGEDVGEILRKVQRGEFPRPRQLDPSIDKALEAVCLKAMALKPEDRYASCRALADDVERWMADEPVTAWQEPWTRKLNRWLTRHRTGVTGVAAAGLAALIGLGAVAVVQARANAQLSRSKQAVQDRYDVAVEAIKAFHTGVSEDFLLKEEKFKSLRDRLLKSAQDFYGRLSALLGKETDLESRRALAQSNFELAELTDKVGRKEEALAAHRAVLATREALAAEPRSDAAVKAEVGQSLTAVATLLGSTGQTDAALVTFRHSESLLARLATSEPAARAELAACRSGLGYFLLNRGESADALAVYKLALTDQEALAATPKASNDARQGLATTLARIGVLLRNTDGPAEAEPAYRTALEIRQKLADDNPGVVAFRSALAYSHFLVGTLLSDTGRTEEAATEYRTAMSIQQKLVDDNPAVAVFQRNLATSRQANCGLLYEAGRLAEAEAECRATLLITQKLVDDNPAVTHFRMDLARSYLQLTDVLEGLGRGREAQDANRTVAPILQKLADENPAEIMFRFHLADCHYARGALLMDSDRPEEAEPALRAAVAIQQKLTDDNPSLSFFRGPLADSHNRLGWLLAQSGRPTVAEPEYRKAMAIYQTLADQNLKVANYRIGAANVGNNLAVALRRLGRLSEARQLCERSVAAQEALVREDPGQSDYFHQGRAESYLNRGLTSGALGDSAGAAADAHRAVAIFDALPPASGERWFLSACAHAALAGMADVHGSGVSAAEAAPEAEKAVALLREAVGLGYRNLDAFRHEDALDPLRGRDDFKLLMMDLAFPAEPFCGSE
jgi:serine/threonine-protein kinase